MDITKTAPAVAITNHVANNPDNVFASRAAAVNANTSPAAPTEVFVNLSGVCQVAGEYSILVSGPTIEPRGNTFLAVLSVRIRNADHSWTNAFNHYAVRFDLSCTTLLFKKQIAHGYDIQGSDLNPWYAPDGSLWGLFGCCSRASETDAAFVPGILDIKFQD